MPKTETHNAIVLRPFPGSRFSIFGADVELQFQRGKEREVYQWLHDWLDAYVLPEVIAAEKPAYDPNPEITRLQAQIESDQKARQIESDQKARGNPGITNTEQKIAAMDLHNTRHATKAAPSGFTPTVRQPAPFVNMPKPGVPVVYGANGPMSAEEIAALPDKPIPGIGYVAPSAPSSTTDVPDETSNK